MNSVKPDRQFLEIKAKANVLDCMTFFTGSPICTSRNFICTHMLPIRMDELMLRVD